MPGDQTSRKRRRVNGEGSVYKRADGYWAGAFDVPTTSGARKRVVVYGKTLAEAREKLSKVQQDVRSGIPLPDKVWKLGPYLDYWLENFVKRKTQAGKRGLPLLDAAAQALKLQAERQALYRIDMGSAWPESGLVFTTRTGRPVEPRNFVRSFRRICDDNKIRLIKVHHVRHTVGSLLKDLGVPARDAQTILGHTRISTTLEIYTDTDEQARRNALTRLQSLLGETQS
jgi:hypothetical protein